MSKASVNQVIQSYASRYNVSKKQAKEEIGKVSQILCDMIAEYGGVTINNCITLEAKERSARTGRNPATGEQIEIPAKMAVKCKITDSYSEELMKSLG